MAKMTKEEFLETLFHDDYENLKGKKTAYDPRPRTGKGSVSGAYYKSV